MPVDINALIKSGVNRRLAASLAKAFAPAGTSGGGGGTGANAYTGVKQLQGATFSTNFINGIRSCTISTWMAPVQQSYTDYGAPASGPNLHVGTNGRFDLLDAGLYRFSITVRATFADSVNGTDLPHAVTVSFGTGYEGTQYVIPVTTGYAPQYINGTGVYEQRDVGPYWFDAYNASNGDQGRLSLSWDAVGTNSNIQSPSGPGLPQVWMYIAKVG